MYLNVTMSQVNLKYFIPLVISYFFQNKANKIQIKSFLNLPSCNKKITSINQPRTKHEVYSKFALVTQNKYTLKFVVVFKAFHEKDNQFHNTQSPKLRKGITNRQIGMI